ncbi:Glycosyltransferase [Methanosarcina siciliae T4/M]|uniref:Glycosyltransferase n=2 Tax=Methanosarcina siciliae TaxID=38027 RepID=A0A0E3P6Z9_9EURY|nr:glycosyltransferase family 4 protein [Methanosarcina siciliae]AKB29605.1 Glycosyltransferase [Methanosarcina siciliae T4/M]
MKVLMLNYEYPPLGGGGSNACKYLLREMANKAIEVDLVTSSPSNIFETETIGDTVSIYKLPVNKKDVHYWTQREILSYSWKAKNFINNLLNENKYDLCHAFFGVPCGAIAYLFRKKIPYIVSLRGSDVPGFNNRFGFQYIFLKPLIKKVWDNAGVVVANSQGLKELALKTSPSQEIGVIYNGVDISEFEPDFSREDGSEIKIVCVSRLIKRKGINYLIEAVGKLKDKQIQLTLVGEGNQEEELRKLVDDLKISDRVDFKGYVGHGQIAEIYRNSDIFVLPSLNEGMSNALLEALAAGLPVIVTDTGGTSELLDGNGALVPMGNSDAIAQAIRSFVDNPGKFRHMGLRSREIAEEMDWMRVGEAYLKLYEELG